MKSPLESFARASTSRGIQNTMKTKAKRILATLFWAAIIATLVWVFAREHAMLEGGAL